MCRPKTKEALLEIVRLLAHRDLRRPNNTCDHSHERNSPNAPASVGGRLRLEIPAGRPERSRSPAFADGSWRTVNLPHDWSIESAPDKDNPSASGGGFFPAGIGWYRKTFTAPSEWKGKRVSVEFDCVYKNATVYLNGHKLGMHPYGYTSFVFDLTPDLDFSAANVLAVRVDNSEQPNSRWYSGSGIYQHVRVVVTNPTHVAHWGVFAPRPKPLERGDGLTAHAGGQRVIRTG